MDFGFVEVGSITVICVLIGLFIKTSKLDDKYIPCIVGLSGAVLGVIAFLTHMPDFPADHILTAIAIGIVSGLAATGAHQVYKQLSDKSE